MESMAPVTENPPPYRVEYYSTGMDDDDLESRFKVRRNGKVFYIDILPSNFSNSPAMAKTYMAYLEVLRSGEQVLGEICETDAIEWVVKPFEALLAALAPPPPGGPQTHSHISTTAYFPRFFHVRA